MSNSIPKASRYYEFYLLGKKYSIPYFNKSNFQYKLNKINIFASGPSVENIKFTNDLLLTPTLFVNGSLLLTNRYHFDNIIGYVITDARFIDHQYSLLMRYYKGQPLFATADVFDTMVKRLPKLMSHYIQNFTLIYAVDKPIDVESKSNKWLIKLSKLFSKKTNLIDFAPHPDFVINVNHLPKPIGVSLDTTNGFVEAGTVAYVAAQLAFSMGAKQIHLYGIDLINSSEPRFYENNDNAAPCKLDKAVSVRIVPSFNLMGLEYKKRGVKVINHSTVSKDLFQLTPSS